MKSQYYTATSLDGFIATEDDSIEWLFPLGNLNSSSYPDFIAKVGALAMGAFLALDGLLETFLTILNQMEVFESVIEQELMRYLPFLLTTTVMMEAVKADAGRETAHEVIKEHAVQVAKDMRTGKVRENDLLTRLVQDDRLTLTETDMQRIVDAGKNNTGDALEQVDAFCARVAAIAAEFWKARGMSLG